MPIDKWVAYAGRGVVCCLYPEYLLAHRLRVYRAMITWLIGLQTTGLKFIVISEYNYNSILLLIETLKLYGLKLSSFLSFFDYQ